MTDSVGTDLRDAVDAFLREKGGDDEHFYGAWYGGSKSAGGHSGGKGSRSGPGKAAPHSTGAGGGAAASAASEARTEPIERNEFWAEKAFASWGSSLSPQERDTLEHFTGDGYFAINKTLAGHEADVEDLLGARGAGRVAIAKTEIPHMDSALAKASLPEPVTVYRGGGGSALSDLKPGAIVSRPTFTSTTLDRSIARGFASDQFGVANSRVIYRMDLPKGFSAAYVNAAFKDAGDEQEMLLARGARFRVASVDQDERFTSVHLVGLS